MNSSSIRAKARQVKSQTYGIYSLYLIPILANILSHIQRYSNNSPNSSSITPTTTTDTSACCLKRKTSFKIS